jgi:hypothetical protein
MAKKKTTTVTTEERVVPDNDEVKIGEPDPTELDSLDEWDALDDAEGLKFTVHKLPSRAGEREAYCMTYSATDLSLDTIRETFGGGTFRITARNTQNQYQGSKRVSIIDLPKPPVPGGQGEYLRAGERSNVESMALVMKMMENQSNLLTSLLTRPPPAPVAGPTALELVQLIKAMERKETDPVTTLLKGLELGKSLGGGGETNFLDVAMQGLSAVAPMIQAQAAKPKVAQPPAPAALNAPAAAPAPVEPQKTEGEMLLLQKLNFLRVVTAQLVERASHGKREDGEFVKDPDLYAEVFLDNLPEFISLDEIIERMKAPDALEQLAQINPAVKAHAEWFTAFRQAVLDSVEEDEEPPPDGGDLV